METPETQVSKDRTGWQARTRIPLEDHRILTISTHKSTAAVGTSLISSASVATVNQYGIMTHVMNYGVGNGDFHASLLVSTTRVTEKAVREQHALALALVEIEGLKARIARHYALQAAASQSPVAQPDMAA